MTLSSAVGNKGFHFQQKGKAIRTEQFFVTKPFHYIDKQLGKIVVTAGQYVQCPAINEILLRK